MITAVKVKTKRESNVNTVTEKQCRISLVFRSESRTLKLTKYFQNCQGCYMRYDNHHMKFLLLRSPNSRPLSFSLPFNDDFNQYFAKSPLNQCTISAAITPNGFWTPIPVGLVVGLFKAPLAGLNAHGACV